MKLEEYEAFKKFNQTGDIASALGSSIVELCGLYGAAAGKLISEISANNSILVIVPEPEDADDVADDILLFGGSSLVFPSWDILPSETEAPDVDIARERVGALRGLLSGKEQVVVASATALLQPVLPPDSLNAGSFSVSAGYEISPEGLCGRLVDAGFESVDEVEMPGHFARRGGIVDVFPFFLSRPVRLEFFGDEIDTVRFFDTGTQRSDAPTSESIILIDINRDSFHRAYESREKTSLSTYLSDDSIVVFLHPAKVEYSADLYYSGFDKRNPLFQFSEIISAYIDKSILTIPEIGKGEWFEAFSDTPKMKSFNFNAKSLERLSGGFEHAFSELEVLAENKQGITVMCNNAAERTRLNELLLEHGQGLANKLELKIGNISKGFHALDSNWAITSDREILGRMQGARTSKKRIKGTPIQDFTQLRAGDYVVHLSHGIAVYEGFKTLENNGTEADYLELRFSEDARIYVPLSHVDLVQRYIGGRDGRPKLSKLGGVAWQNRKKAAEAAARDIAADLLRLQAARSSLPGIAFPEDDEMVLEFDNAFPFNETPDQLSAIADIKEDQQKSSPMDRLLCGDVGFGKTEVAMRAAFKVVNSGKQAAILVPTTILAEQHCRSFRQRMADFPVRVECLSRFRTGKESSEIIDGIEKGQVDIVIGTHRILSKDVSFRDLGIVIIDEEQRFGVEQKERLKEMRVSVDVLSMSATPIPRTLNMALLGVRDISNLTTAPTERQSIRTEVLRFNEELIRRAMLRELARGGQVFFLHNRVRSIEKMASDLADLVPEARFGIAHGQMSERQLFEVMNRFLDRKIDVLVCTTIIESGVDIPSVNTLFVNNADHFGLGELHQLRGRVGRYRSKAYSYFLIPPKRPVNPIAKKRLAALEEYSELGSGFRLAMRDLEIRGAGNILGAEQSGHIHLIGFDLYCRLLEKSVATLRGDTVEDAEPVELDLGSVAYIPTEYISSDTQRIDFYRKLSGCDTEEQLDNLSAFARDKYGAMPEMVLGLFEDQRLRQLAQEAGINYLGRIDGALSVGFAAGAGGQGLRKLRLMRRKVTPLDRRRWRVSIGKTEDFYQAATTVVVRLNLDEQTLIRRSEEITAAKKEQEPKLESKVARDRRYQQMTSSLGGSFSAIDAKVEEQPAKIGADIFEIEGNEKLGTVAVLVSEDGFNQRKFGAVTMLCGEKRFFLRYIGTAHSGSKVYLNLRTDSEADISVVLKSFKKADSSILLNGLVE